MRFNLPALLGLLTACQTTDLVPASNTSSDPQSNSSDGGEGSDASDDVLDDSLHDTGDVPEEDEADEVVAGDPSGRVLRGDVVGAEWAGGQVVAISSEGTVVEAIIGDSGSFALALTRGLTWTLHLRAEGQPVVTFHFERNAGSTETTTLLSIPAEDAAPPPGAPPPGDDTAGADDLELGTVTPTDSGATSETNPLEEVDADGDGVSDYEDPDDDGDGVQDELDSEPEVDASVLGLVVQKAYPALGSDDVDPDSEIMVEFSLELDPSSVRDSSLQLVGPDGTLQPGTVELAAADLYFQPSAPMLPGEAYSVVVEEGLVSLSGEELVGEQSWTFAVEAETDEVPAILEIEDIHPLHGAVVDGSALLSVEFNQAMSASAAYLGTGGLQVIAADGAQVEGLLTVDDDRVAFEPHGGLEAGASYWMVIGMQLYSETGLGLDRALEIGFSVDDDGPVDDDDGHIDDDGSVDDDGSIDDDDGHINDDDDGSVDDDEHIDDDDGHIDDDGSVDDDGHTDDDGHIDDDDTSDDPEVAFSVLHVYPQDGQVVDAYTELMVEFSDELAASGVYQGVGGLQVIGADGVEVEGQLWVHGSSLFFIPNAPLQAGGSYEMVVGMQLMSVTGEGLAEDLRVGFTVAASHDDGTEDDGTIDDDASHDDGTGSDGTIDDDASHDDGTGSDGTIDDDGNADGTIDDDDTTDDPAVAFSVLHVYPEEGQVVDAYTELMVEFSEELAASGVYQGVGGLQVIGSDGVEVEGQLWVHGSSLFFIPNAPLQAGGSYEMVVGMQLMSVTGEGLAEDLRVGFSVAASHDDGTGSDGTIDDDTSHDDGTGSDGTIDDDASHGDGTEDEGTGSDGTIDGDASHGDGTDDGTAADGTSPDDGTAADGSTGDSTHPDDGTAADGSTGQ